MSYLDTDTSLTANSDVKVASQKAVKTYVDAQNGSQNTTISANATTMNNHISNTSNPHATTKAQVSLGNVDNVQQLPMSYLDTDALLQPIRMPKLLRRKPPRRIWMARYQP